MEISRGIGSIKERFSFFLSSKGESRKCCDTEELRSISDYPMFGLVSGSDLFTVRLNILFRSFGAYLTSVFEEVPKEVRTCDAF